MKKTAISITLLAFCLSLGLTVQSCSAKTKVKKLVSTARPAGKLDESLLNEANAAMNRGLDWLAANQKRDGSWSNPEFPALTAFALQAFAKSDHTKKKEVMPKAIKFILAHVHEDGSIYKTIEGRKGGGLKNYNTAVCMTALHSISDPALNPVVLKARTYMSKAQHLETDTYAGGFGYDASTAREYADGINTLMAIVAMVETAGVEDLRDKAEKRADLDWKAAVKFLDSLQDQTKDDGDNPGGFHYRPDDNKAGTVTNKAGTVKFRSYGSMTYAGLMSMIYAQVPRDDPRVLSAFDWARNHWTLTENPGMGGEGLYFFYNILAKSLDAYGTDVFETQKKFVDWRRELVTKYVRDQKQDTNGRGYWVNETGRFWENDPVLVTSYSILAMQIAVK